MHIPDQAKHHQERAARCDRVAGLHEISALTICYWQSYIYIYKYNAYTNVYTHIVGVVN